MIDYNSKVKRAGTGRAKAKSPNSAFGVAKNRDGKSNNRYTGFTVRGGGAPSTQTIQRSYSKGLQTTAVCRPIDTAMNKDKTVWRGGGRPSRKIVQQQKGTSAVRPE